MYLPGLNQRLISTGQLMNEGLTMSGNKAMMTFSEGNKVIMTCLPHQPNDTIMWVDSEIMSVKVNPTIFTVNFEVWHRRLGHPSDDVMRHFVKHTGSFPKDFKIPGRTSICKGCAEGKMKSSPFPPSQSRADKPFDLLHSDLKEFPTKSYHKFKYALVIFDDHSSHGWSINLKAKSDTLNSIKDFVKYVEVNHDIKIKSWRFDQ